MAAELRHPGQLLRHIRIVEQHHRHIRGPRRILRLAHAQLTKRPLIVKARRIDKDHGADAVQFHRLVHGVSCRARDLRDRGHGLPGQSIEQTGLAAVAAAVETDMQACSPGGIIQTHLSITLLYVISIAYTERNVLE